MPVASEFSLRGTVAWWFTFTFPWEESRAAASVPVRAGPRLFAADCALTHDAANRISATPTATKIVD